MYYKLGYGLILYLNNSELQNDCSDIFISYTFDTDAAKIEFIVINAELQSDNVHFYKNDVFITSTPRLLWIATLVKVINKIAIDNYCKDFIIIHGSCIQLDVGAVVYIGGSKSGKSTAVYKSISEYNAMYVSDELVLYDPKTNCIIPEPHKVIQLRNGVSGITKTVRDEWDMHDVSFISPIINFPKQIQYSPIPLKYLIDIAYIQDSYSTNIVKLPSNKALNILLKQVFNITKVNVSHIVYMLSRLSCFYQCRYDGNLKMIVEEISCGK